MCISIDSPREGDGLTRNRPLDQKDVDILGALEELGGKTSTEELSLKTGIPARTVRYRLKKMRDNKVLYPAKTLTHERKLGLGEIVLIVHTTPGSDSILEKIFHKIASLYFWGRTYGRYNGYIINSLYSLTTPNVSLRLLEALKNEGLISEFYVFDITDYENKFGDFRYLDPKLGWQYDWTEWQEKIKKNLKSKKRTIQTKCDENPSLIEFDNNDFGLLRGLFDNAEVPQKELAKQFSLSETQVTKKIRRLESAGIIKGYGASSKTMDDYVYFNVYLEIMEPAARIVNNLYTHPFLSTIMIESRTRWGLRMGLPSSDLYGFLAGLDLMKPYLKSCVFQIIHSWTRDGNFHPYDLFNKETHKWETPVSKYLEVISEVMKQSHSKSK